MARANEKSYAVGQGRTNEDIRRREANLGVDMNCRAQLADAPPGSRDIFNRTFDEIEKEIDWQQRTLEIAKSGR